MTMYHLQVGEQGKSLTQFQCKPEHVETRGVNNVSPCLDPKVPQIRNKIMDSPE